MTNSDLQLGGGYAYQWNCAILIALEYLVGSHYGDEADLEIYRLVRDFLEQVEAIQLEGRKKEDGAELEDINLLGSNREVHIQVKAKERGWWTLGEAALRKALYRFYCSSDLKEESPSIRFVFLTNQGFNQDISRLREAIANGKVAQCQEADTLFGYLQDYVNGQYDGKDVTSPVLDRPRFNQMLQNLCFVEFFSEDRIEAFSQNWIRAEGLADAREAYQALFTEFAKRSIRKEKVTLNDLYKIVPELHRGRLVNCIQEEPRRSVAKWIQEQAERESLPPLSTTSEAVIKKAEALVGNEQGVLNEVEAFLLLAAICLPHLLARYGDYTEQQLSSVEIRELAAKIGQELSSPSELGSVLLVLSFELALIANSRIGFDLQDDQYNDVELSGMRVRLRLVAALLHLADQLNLDQFTDPELPGFLEQAEWAERYRWWRQAYVRSVSIETQRIKLYLQLPDREDYPPILVDPLDDQIRGLIRIYDSILIAAGINLNFLDPDASSRDGVQLIPDDEWRLLKREVEAEQARRSKSRLHTSAIQEQRLRESLVKAETSQAERMQTEGRHKEAAEAFALAAGLLARNRDAAQARYYATSAAEEYLRVRDYEAAAEQYLQAATVWLDNASSPVRTTKHLEKAHEFAAKAQNPGLQIRVLLAQAREAFASMRDQDAERLLKQANELLIEIHDDASRSSLLRDIALQHATCAMVWKELETAKDILNSAIERSSETSYDVRLDLLQHLLIVNVEQGEWQSAQDAYERAERILESEIDLEQQGLLRIQYGTSLARQGRIAEAYTVYNEALEQLDGYTDAYTLGLAYQSVEHMLLRNGVLSYDKLNQHEIRRIDLFKKTQSENRGYAHKIAASTELGEQNYRLALQNIRLAVFYYWQEGAWAGIEGAYQTLARLRFATDDMSGALQAAIRGSDRKAVKQHSKTLKDRGNKALIAEVVETLLADWTISCDQRLATVALGVLSEVIPPNLLDEVVEHLLTLLRGPEDTLPQREARRYATEALRNLIPQLTPERISEVANIALDQLDRQQFWAVVEEILKLLYSCFVVAPTQLESRLYESVSEAMLTFNRGNHLDEHAKSVLISLARTASPEIRAKVILHLGEHSSEFELARRLALLKEPVPEESLRAAIEHILTVINPKPKVEEQDGKKSTSVGFGGISPRALNIFNDIFPKTLYDQVINGLLEAIINENNVLATRSDAIFALSNLPEGMLVERANEVAEYLLWGAEGDLPRSSIVDLGIKSQSDPFSAFRMYLGNVEQLRRSSLEALGRLYSHVDEKHRAAIDDSFLKASRDASPIVRQGLAMAFDNIGSGHPLSRRLLLALIVLLHDRDPRPCSWACKSSGHIVVCDLAEEFTEDIVARLLNLATTADVVDVRVGAGMGLREIADAEQCPESDKERISMALELLADDVSFRVRREVA